MARVKQSGRARDDLREIWLFIAKDNAAAADRLIRHFNDIFKQLAEHPKMGRSRMSLAPDLRSHPVGSYVVFYRLIDRGIEIVRVLHGARDIDATFAE